MHAPRGRHLFPWYYRKSRPAPALGRKKQQKLRSHASEATIYILVLGETATAVPTNQKKSTNQASIVGSTRVCFASVAVPNAPGCAPPRAPGEHGHIRPASPAVREQPGGWIHLLNHFAAAREFQLLLFNR